MLKMSIRLFTTDISKLNLTLAMISTFVFASTITVCSLTMLPDEHVPLMFLPFALSLTGSPLSYQLLTLVRSVMAVLQKSMSFSLMGTLAASCLLLIALWAQEANALPVNTRCKLEVSNFQQPYIVNRTFMLAKEVQLHLFLSIPPCHFL